MKTCVLKCVKVLRGYGQSGLTPLYEVHHLDDNSRASTRYRYLLMRKLLILYSSVVCGIPSLLAAPSEPEMRPPVSASAASMSSRSWLIRGGCRPTGSSASGCNHACSTKNVSESHRITARSMTF